MPLLDNVYLDLSAKCDRRTKALDVALEGLGKIHSLLLKSKKRWSDKQRLMFTICDKTLDQIELFENGGANGNKL